MNINERQIDLLHIIEKLDIPASLYENAVHKYKAIAKYLENHGLIAAMYPQGSFALGTVIRPYSKDKEKNYDLDFICQVSGNRNDTTPSELRNQILDILNTSDLYGGKLTKYDECFTIEYADVNGIGFSIDIVPATAETPQNIAELRSLSEYPQLIDTAIAIPRHSKQKTYNWITNNPKGYQQWFSDINTPFKIASRMSIRKSIYESNTQIYASVEDVPSELERSSLQRVIQILKYHRDVHYSNIYDGNNIKPISAIINTLVTEIARTTNPNLDVFELLEYVLKELTIYSHRQELSVDEFKKHYGARNIIVKENGMWIITNPANPKDNLADKWNSNSDIPRRFFEWISTVEEHLINSLVLEDADFRTKAETAFGYTTVAKAWNNKYYASKPKPIPTIEPVKPWRCK